MPESRSATRLVNPLRASVTSALFLAATLACNSSSTPTVTQVTPTSPTPPAASTVTSVVVTGSVTVFERRGETAQFNARATLSTGATEDRTLTATWQSDNPAVATVSDSGVVTAQEGGSATISAVIGNVRGSQAVSVRSGAAPTPGPPGSVGPRTPDPPPGQRLPLPNVEAFIAQANAARPELLAQSCNRGIKYVTNPWLDYIVDRLRTLDTRWGYNGKPNRTAADNSGVPVVAAGDEIAYHYGPGPDEGSPDVHLVDILVGHCGTPSLGWRVFTGEEPGRWTGAGRF